MECSEASVAILSPIRCWLPKTVCQQAPVCAQCLLLPLCLCVLDLLGSRGSGLSSLEMLISVIC